MASSDKISGVDGDCVYNALTIPITAWSLSLTEATKDVTDTSSSGFKEKLPDGYAEGSGSFEGFVIDGTVAPTVGSSATLTLTAETGVTWSMTAIITGVDTVLTTTGGDAVKMTCTFESDGTITETNA